METALSSKLSLKSKARKLSFLQSLYRIQKGRKVHLSAIRGSYLAATVGVDVWNSMSVRQMLKKSLAGSLHWALKASLKLFNHPVSS